MKKMINLVIITIISTAMINTIEARIAKSNLPPKSKLTQQTSTTTSPKPSQKAITIKKNTKKLYSEIETAKKTKTPYEQKQAEQNATETALELLKDLEERSLLGDVVTGYSEKQIINAKSKLKQLYPLQIQLSENINSLEKKLDSVTDKGWIWNAPSPGKEKEYNYFTKKLDKQKDSLKKVNRAIRNQTVITGQEWSNAFRALLVGAVTLGIDKIIFGGAGMTTLGSYATQGTGMLAGSLVNSWYYLKILGTHGMQAASMALSLKKTYDTANAVYAFYDSIANDPNQSPEARKNAVVKRDAVAEKLKTSKTNLVEFENKLKTMSKEELDKLLISTKELIIPKKDLDQLQKKLTPLNKEELNELFFGTEQTK